MNPDQQQSQDNTANLPEAPATDAQPVTTVEQSAAQAPIAEPVTEAPVQPEAPAPEAPVEPAVETTPPVETCPGCRTGFTRGAGCRTGCRQSVCFVYSSARASTRYCTHASSEPYPDDARSTKEKE